MRKYKKFIIFFFSLLCITFFVWNFTREIIYPKSVVDVDTKLSNKFDVDVIELELPNKFSENKFEKALSKRINVGNSEVEVIMIQYSNEESATKVYNEMLKESNLKFNRNINILKMHSRSYTVNGYYCEVYNNENIFLFIKSKDEEAIKSIKKVIK